MDYSTDSADETEEQKNSIFEKKVLAKYPDMEFQRTSDGKSYYIGGATSEDDDLDNETSLAEETEEGEQAMLRWEIKAKKPKLPTAYNNGYSSSSKSDVKKPPKKKLKRKMRKGKKPLMKQAKSLEMR